MCLRLFSLGDRILAEHLQANQLAYYCGSPFVFSSFPLQIKDMCLIILYFICCDPSLMNS